MHVSKYIICLYLGADGVEHVWWFSLFLLFIYFLLFIKFLLFFLKLILNTILFYYSIFWPSINAAGQMCCYCLLIILLMGDCSCCIRSNICDITDYIIFDFLK